VLNSHRRLGKPQAPLRLLLSIALSCAREKAFIVYQINGALFHLHVIQDTSAFFISESAKVVTNVILEVIWDY